MSTPPPVAAPGWWEHRLAIAAFLILTALPLLWPDIPPLVDLPGHMGRYRLQLDLVRSPFLQGFYSFDWALIGNLGVDLLVVPLSKLFGLELAVRLIVMAIPPLTVAGFLWVSREVHGRVPPTALFALPLVFNFPFMFGFVNFALSMALAFLAFGLWLRLGRQGRTTLRAAMFVPLSLIVWITHAFGWGTLGLMAFGAELVRQEEHGRAGVLSASWRAALRSLPLAPPVLLMLAWRSGQVAGETGDWFNVSAKLEWVLMIFRDQWKALDLASLGLLIFVVFIGVRNRGFGLARTLGVAAAALFLVFLLLPRIVFGSAFADMRLAPFVLAVAILAIRTPRASWLGRTAALAGLAFIVVRTAATTVSFLVYDASFDRELAALEHLPRGARTAAFVGVDCEGEWATRRTDHLPAFAIVRREAFANDQWAMQGAQLLRVVYPAGGAFVSDPSQLVRPQTCHATPWLKIDEALRRLPRGAFDYIWLIDPPAYDARLTQGLRPVWRSGRSVLFRIER